jgi:hypothetical protein
MSRSVQVVMIRLPSRICLRASSLMRCEIFEKQHLPIGYSRDENGRAESTKHQIKYSRRVSARPQLANSSFAVRWLSKSPVPMYHAAARQKEEKVS